MQLETWRKCPLHLLTPISNRGFAYSTCGLHSSPSSPRFCSSEPSCSPPAGIPLSQPFLPSPPLSPCYTVLSTLSESPDNIHCKSPTSLLHLPYLQLSVPGRQLDIFIYSSTSDDIKPTVPPLPVSKEMAVHFTGTRSRFFKKIIKLFSVLLL